MTQVRAWHYDHGKMLFEDGDWALIKGPISLRMDSQRYFLHHTCKVLDEEGNPQRQNWFDPQQWLAKTWCNYCDSEPPEALQGLFAMMVYL